MSVEKPSTEPVLEIKGLAKTFRDFWWRPTVRAIDEIDLEIPPGEVFGLLGPNGSGKSTTLKIILGLLYPSSGAINLFGKSPSNVAIKKYVGYLPEESYLYKYLTPRETLDFYARLFNIPANIRKQRTEELLDMVGLLPAADRSVGEFSKGMARRVGLAQALVNNPRLVIFDEPTSGLDPIGCRQVKDLILALAKRGKTVILSSHLLADVEDVCDRIAILYNGSIRAMGRVNALLAEPENCRLKIPSLPPEKMKRLLESIRNQTGTMPEMDHPSMNLEKFFLKVVEEAYGKPGSQSGVTKSGRLPEYLDSHAP